MPLSVLRGERRPGDRWTEHDTTMAVGLQLHDASIHPACGHPIAETTSPDADPFNRDAKWWYEAPVPVVCHACVVIQTRTKEYAEHSQREHLLFRAVKRTDDDAEPADGG